MELKKQITSLELSKRLKELGYPQEGLFWWLDKPERHVNFEPSKEIIELTKGVICVAPTVAELGEVLAKYGCYGSWKGESGWCVTEIFNQEFPELDSDTEANVRAKMLIFLLENEFIDLK